MPLSSQNKGWSIWKVQGIYIWSRNPLRSDNGGEYTSKELIAYCKEAVIKRELIVPYNLEQKGVAEKKNGTIEECIRTMTFDQDLPKFLWGEATMTTIYIQNRSPHRILDNMTPVLIGGCHWCQPKQHQELPRSFMAHLTWKFMESRVKILLDRFSSMRCFHWYMVRPVVLSNLRENWV